MAARIIDVALALKNGVSDSELTRSGLSREQAVALVQKRHRHPKVVAFIGDSLDALRQSAPAVGTVDPLRARKNFLEGAARFALALLETNPQMTRAGAIEEAAGRVRVDHWEIESYSKTGADKRTSPPVMRTTARRTLKPVFGRVDVAGVRREVGRLFSAWPKAKRRATPGAD